MEVCPLLHHVCPLHSSSPSLHILPLPFSPFSLPLYPLSPLHSPSSPSQLTTMDCVTINETAGSLSICNTTALSAGLYSCLAQNLAGSVEFSVIVTVLSDPPMAPVIINRTQTSIIKAGEPLILDCIVSGSPPPSVTWLKNGVSWYTYYRERSPPSPLSPIPLHTPPFSLPSGGTKLHMSRCPARGVQSSGRCVSVYPDCSRE